MTLIAQSNLIGYVLNTVKLYSHYQALAKLVLIAVVIGVNE